MPTTRVLPCFLLVFALPAAAAQIVRGPYLQSASHEKVTVRWRSDVAMSSRVLYGASPQSLVEAVEITGARTEHGVRISGLAPDQIYYYAIADGAQILAGGDAEHRFRTAPWPGQSAAQRIWVLGDVGTGDANAAAVRDAYYAWNGAPRADLVLLLGDNAYNTGTDAEYQSGFFVPHAATLRGSLLWPAFGNHDGYGSDGIAETGPYFDSFNLPTDGSCGGAASGHEAYYAFDFGSVHFVCLDSYANDKSAGAPMLQWLAADLSLPSVVAAQWRIAFWHHPPYSKGSHDSDVEWELIQMRQNVLPILEAGGVDLVLSGHSHGYERSMLLDSHYGSSTTLEPSMILDAGSGSPPYDGAYRKSVATLPHAGTVYVVAGSAGKLSQAGTLAHPAMFVSQRSLGSVVLDIDGTQLDLRFLTADGRVTDGFTLLRTDSVGTPAQLSAQLTLRPNPVPSSGLVSFSWPQAENVRVSLFDLRGRRVAPPLWLSARGANDRTPLLFSQLAGRLPAGSYVLEVDGARGARRGRLLLLP